MNDSFVYYINFSFNIVLEYVYNVRFLFFLYLLDHVHYPLVSLVKRTFNVLRKRNIKGAEIHQSARRKVRNIEKYEKRGGKSRGKINEQTFSV